MPDAGRWISTAADVLTRDDVRAARRRLQRHLIDEFSASAGARVILDLTWSTVTLRGFPDPLPLDREHRPHDVEELAAAHPMLDHYLTSGSLRPRVLLRPEESTATLPVPLVDFVRTVGLGMHQLVLPLRNEPRRAFETYMLIREEPFPRWALPRATALHDLVRGLHQHLALREVESPPTVASAENPITLTPRELTILTLLAESRTASSIGHTLAISTRTVHKHLENTYRKLGVSDRVAAISAARRRGLLAEPEDPAQHRLSQVARIGLARRAARDA